LHHIIPKSLGGVDDDTNTILLTAREHYICHLLLTKMLVNMQKSKMIFAFFRFFNEKYTNSKIYERFKNNLNLSGENNPFYGKHHSEENKKKFSGENHGLFGKGLHINWIEKYGLDEANRRNEKYKKNLSNALIGRNKTIGTTGRKVIFKDGIEKRVKPDDVQYFLDNGWQLSSRKIYESICKYCNKKIINFKKVSFCDRICSGKSQCWMHTENKEIRIKSSELDQYISEGWIKGRLKSS
jgi:hypothetical protein